MKIQETYKVEGSLNGDIRGRLTLELGWICSNKVDDNILLTVFDVKDNTRELIEKLGLKILEIIESNRQNLTN